MNSAIRKKPIVLCLIFIIISCSSCNYLDNKTAFEVQTPDVMNTVTPTISSTPAASSNAAKEEILPINQNQNVVKSWEEYDASYNPLIAAIPEKNIYLYAVKPQGVILYVNGIKHTYDWINITPRFILPKMYYGDFNLDGNYEIVVIPYVGSGTGVSIEELHIIDAKNFTDTHFESQSYITQLDNIVKLKTYENSGEIYADIDIEQQTYSAKVISKKDVGDGSVEQNAYFGNIVRFNVVDGKIKAEFVLGMSVKPSVSLYYIGNVNSDVVYTDNKLILKNARFSTDNKNP